MSKLRLKLSPTSFSSIEKVFASFQEKGFAEKNRFEQLQEISKALYDLILSHAERRFLLAEVIDYIARISKSGLVERYTFSDFELWLNQFSHLSAEKNQHVRSLITGKKIPRDEYQLFFPIGGGKVYEGSHFVTAHSSPDLDTTVASFWGWMDAFAARVSKGRHLWNVPGGAMQQSVEIDLLFYQTLGPSVFDALAKTRGALTVSSLDLMTQEGVQKRTPGELMVQIDHERNQNTVILVSPEGHYLGDWRHFDVEGVRQVIMLLNNLLRWIENELHVELISLFARPQLRRGEITEFVRSVFDCTIRDLEPAKEYTMRQMHYLHLYLQTVFGLQEGVEATFHKLAEQIEQREIADFKSFYLAVETLEKSSLFDQSDLLVENRPLIFSTLHHIVKSLSEVFRSIRRFVEQLGVALQIKTEVFGYKPQFLTDRTDILEMRSKIDSYPYLSVTLLDPRGFRIPIGVITALDLNKPVLGTVTLRDFSNLEETAVPDYLQVISVIDHHKTTLKTSSPPMAIICDAQSSNAIVAELALSIYDRYSLGDMSPSEIDAQIEKWKKEELTAESMRLLTRLYQKKSSLAQKGEYFIDPRREELEYLHYIHAILDDTDLLTKVSYRDVLVMARLLNAIASLEEKKMVEVINYDDLPLDESFTASAARRLLQHPLLYSFYKNLYAAKEAMIDEQLIRCSKGLPSPIFADTKIQNGCARIGQTKIFAKNHPLFTKLTPNMKGIWLEGAKEAFKDSGEIDLHMQMCSTVASAEELHKGNSSVDHHLDQLWIWIPFTEVSIEHLKLFLSAFKNSPPIAQSRSLSLEVSGPHAEELAAIFKESFLPCEAQIVEGHKLESVAVLFFEAGILNSRKAQVSPYLPKK